MLMYHQFKEWNSVMSIVSFKLTILDGGEHVFLLEVLPYLTNCQLILWHLFV